MISAKVPPKCIVLIKSKLGRFLPSGHKKTRGGNNEGFSHYVIENKQGQMSEWDIHLTQVTPISCGLAGAERMIEVYGAGSTATACWTSRKNSFPRLRDLRRLNRKVNSSR